MLCVRGDVHSDLGLKLTHLAGAWAGGGGARTTASWAGLLAAGAWAGGARTTASWAGSLAAGSWAGGGGARTTASWAGSLAAGTWAGGARTTASWAGSVAAGVWAGGIGTAARTAAALASKIRAAGAWAWAELDHLGATLLGSFLGRRRPGLERIAAMASDAHKSRLWTLGSRLWAFGSDSGGIFAKPAGQRRGPPRGRDNTFRLAGRFFGFEKRI